MDVKPNLLLVESDNHWVELISVLLKNLCNMKVVGTAQAAIDALDDGKYQCILLNLQLAGNSGIELLNERVSYADISMIPCVAYSGIEQFSGITDDIWSSYRVDAFLSQTQLASRLPTTLKRVLSK